MRGLAVLVLIAATGTARAQAPGQVPPEPASSVMTDRWAFAVAFGPIWLTPSVDGAKAVKFGAFDVSARYRFRPSIEVALTMTGGGSAGDLTTGGFFADFRYRFRAEQPFNAYVLGGLGVAAAGPKDATEPDKRPRGALRLGGGAEYRFGRFAIFAELTLLGVGENTLVTPVSPPTVAYQLERYGLSGGTFFIGGTVYF